MHKIIFLPENNMCVYLKFSDPLPLTPLFFIWPYHLTGVEGELCVLLSLFSVGLISRACIVFWVFLCYLFSSALMSVLCASSSLCYGMICGCGIPWLYSLDFLWMLDKFRAPIFNCRSTGT